MSSSDDFDRLAAALYKRAKKIWPDLTMAQLKDAGFAAMNTLTGKNISNRQIMDATTAELNRRFRHTGKQL